MWKARHDLERMRGMNCVKQIARLAAAIIPSNENSYDIELVLVLNFED